MCRVWLHDDGNCTCLRTRAVFLAALKLSIGPSIRSRRSPGNVETRRRRRQIWTGHERPRPSGCRRTRLTDVKRNDLNAGSWSRSLFPSSTLAVDLEILRSQGRRPCPGWFEIPLSISLIGRSMIEIFGGNATRTHEYFIPDAPIIRNAVAALPDCLCQQLPRIHWAVAIVGWIGIRSIRLPLGELSSKALSFAVDFLPVLGSGFLLNNFLRFSAVHFSRAMHRAIFHRWHLAWN